MSEADEPLGEVRGRSGAAAGGGTAQARAVPLFPLPNLFLFPGIPLQLHIFEPRYRQMIEDSLDGPGRIVIAAVLEGWHDRLLGRPPVHPIAGLGEIVRHERLPDGRFWIFLLGLSRVQIREVESDRLYRKVEAAPVVEEPVPDSLEPALRTRLAQALESRAGELPDLGALPIGQLSDLLLFFLQLPQASMQDLYSCLSIADRAERALREHARRPLPPRRPAGGRSG